MTHLCDISEMLSERGQLLIWTHSPHPCTCGRMTTSFVNRDGRTRCTVCDTSPITKVRELSKLLTDVMSMERNSHE